jgi:signal peptidase I
VAFLLSLFLPGLGQLYAGEALRALVAVMWAFVLMPPAMVSLIGWLSTSGSGLLLAVALCLLSHLLIPIDAAMMARWNRELPKARYNRLGVYAAYVALLVVITFSAWHAVPRTLWYRPFRVSSASMAPTIVPGDHIVGEMRTRELRRGEVVLLVSPGGMLAAKRVIGLAGDQVELRGGELWVNGTLRSLGPAADDERERGPRRERLDVGEFTVWTARDPRADHEASSVPLRHVFVLGDNRAESRDSREWGAVSLDTVRGRVVRVHLSFAPAGERDAAGPFGLRWDRIGTEPFTPVDAETGAE